MAKKSKRKKLQDKLDTLCRLIAREMADDKCERCGKHIEGSNSHPNHIVPIGKGGGSSWRRFDQINIILFCFDCHIWWWHKAILDASKWFKEKYPAQYAYLSIYRGGKPCPIKTAEMEDLVIVKEQKLKELKEK